MKGSSKQKIKAYTALIIGLAFIAVLNLIGQNFFVRVDLTSEQRFSLSKPSRLLATGLKDVVYFKIYLDGEFPAGFKRLQKATKEILEEYKAYAGSKIEYEFVDPFKNISGKDQQQIIEQLYHKGLTPTNVQIDLDDEHSQKVIVPGALVIYNGKEYPLNLMREQFGSAPEVVLNQSIENLEYAISDVLRKCENTRKLQIGFTSGHGELGKAHLADIAQTLMENYEVERFNLNDLPPAELKKFACLIIAKPDSFFSPYERFKLDQYIMHGGKVLWLVENVIADMDSISKYKEFLTPTSPTELDELLFKYGVRVNYNLLSDLQCNYIPILTQVQNGGKQQKMVPWTFFPVLSSDIKHPIVKNLEPILCQFAGTIDTVGNKDVRKTILLRSGPNCRVLNSPVLLSIENSVVKQQEVGYFTKSNLPVAVLLEGKFKSFYANYMIGDSAPKDLNFKAESPESKMIVVADGDIISNQVKESTGEVYPLGYDRYTKMNFGNKKFIQNCIEYLVDGSGLIEVRTKEFQIRLIDRAKVKKEKFKWQIINMVIPVLLILIFAGVNNAIRKQKYS
jgi:ABC-2 type transport system permease protein